MFGSGVVPRGVAEGDGLVVRVEPLQAERSHALPDELVDGRDEKLAIGREFLRRIFPPARIDDGGQVIGAHELADELSSRVLQRRAAHRAHVEIVEHDHVHAAVERLSIGLRVGNDEPALVDELGRLLDGNLRPRERVDLLRLAVLEHLEIVAREPGDEVALGIGDDDVDVDVVHLDLEGDAGCLRTLALKNRRLQGHDRNEEKKREFSHIGTPLFTDRIAGSSSLEVPSK